MVGRFRAAPGALEWLAVLLGSIGVVLLTGGAEFRASPLGTAAILFAITCWSFGSQWSRRLDIPAGASGFAAEMLLGGTLLLIVSALKGAKAGRSPRTGGRCWPGPISWCSAR